jgi:hypothetical protein
LTKRRKILLVITRPLTKTRISLVMLKDFISV